MVKDYYKRSKSKSRLKKIEEKRSLKQAFVFSFLTIGLVIVLIIFGIPALIRLVVFLGDIRTSGLTPADTDFLAPAAPILNQLAEATQVSFINVSGFAEEGTTVKLKINNKTSKEVVAGKDGSFVFNNVALNQGENQVKVKTVDSSGNESPYSEEYTIIFDNIKPNIEVLNPKDGDEFFDKDKEIEVKGKTEEEITLYINSRLTYSNSKGEFLIQIELKEGENEIVIKAKDKAENETEKKLKVTYYP